MIAPVPLSEQIAEVRRELALRKNVYPKRVSSREMRQSEADHLTARMNAVLTTLTWLAENAAAVRMAARLSKIGGYGQIERVLVDYLEGIGLSAELDGVEWKLPIEGRAEDLSLTEIAFAIHEVLTMEGPRS